MATDRAANEPVKGRTTRDEIDDLLDECLALASETTITGEHRAVTQIEIESMRRAPRRA